MAHFYVSSENTRGKTVGIAGKKAGQTTHARGWTLGVRVEGMVNKEGKDVFKIYKTAGTNGASQDEHLITLTEA